jgi:hypothetical protein
VVAVTGGCAWRQELSFPHRRVGWSSLVTTRGGAGRTSTTPQAPPSSTLEEREVVRDERGGDGEHGCR